MHMVTYNMETYESQVASDGLGPLLTSGDDSALAVLGVFFTVSHQCALIHNT